MSFCVICHLQRSIQGVFGFVQLVNILDSAQMYSAAYRAHADPTEYGEKIEIENAFTYKISKNPFVRRWTDQC